MSDKVDAVTSDRRIFDLLDDLEGQAAALYAGEREAEVADRSRAEYAAVTFASRLMASIELPVTLEVAGLGRLAGRLRRVGAGWCLLASASGEWLVPIDSVVAAESLSERSLPEVAWTSVTRLGLGSALRRLADESAPCVVFTREGAAHEVVLERVGADFVEAVTAGESPRRTLLRLAAVSAIQSRPDHLG